MQVPKLGLGMKVQPALFDILIFWMVKTKRQIFIGYHLTLDVVHQTIRSPFPYFFKSVAEGENNFYSFILLAICI